jgi:drug/metabolite transporter (DMT)-like permease
LKNRSSLVGSLLLLLGTLIWGTAFVSQKQANGSIGPFTVICLRSFLAVLFLIAVIIVFDALRKDRKLFSLRDGKFRLDISRTEWLGGGLCGIALWFASYLQQLGLVYNDSAGKTAFITTLYVAFVPILGIFLRRPTAPVVWLGVAGSLVGGYFLAVPAGEAFTVALGDLLVFGGAVFFACHILIIDRFSPRCDGVRMSLVQFLTDALLSLPFVLFAERPAFSDILSGIGPLLYLGIMSSGVAYTLQIIAQGKTHPAVASVIMSLESVVGVLAGALVFGESMTVREYIGCAILLCAVLLTELGDSFIPARKAKKDSSSEAAR